MKNSWFLQHGLTLACLALTVPALSAQTSNITIFNPVYVRTALGNPSGQPDKSSPPANFNTSTLSLNCSVSPIHAVLTSSSNAGNSNANLLVDNFINLTVTPGTSGTVSGTPVDVCLGRTSNSSSSGGTNHSQECYRPGFSSAVGHLVGQNPDTFTATYGVAPLDISSYLVPGPQQAEFDLMELGDYLGSSSIYLNTNCAQTGVSGQVNLTGNPITQTNISQNYPIDSTPNQKFQFVYDLSKAQKAGSLSLNSGTVPYITDIPVDPTNFDSYVSRTSFATSSCLIHTGELLDGQPACTLYTLECTSGKSSAPSGAQCPVSSLPNEIFQDVFDGPGFTLPDIASPNNGPTFHEGVGFLMASEGWTGGPCTFDPASGLQDLTCPQNLLVDFSGPGLYTSSGYTSHPNSTFIPVTGVPEDLTTVNVQNQHPGYWVNTRNAVVTLSSQPPVLTGTNLPGASSFIPSPIQSITYGISPANSILPSPSAPASTDTTVASGVVCPLQADPSDPPATVFTTPNESLTVPADGNYFVHYFARDCAGTEELQFTQNASTSSWSTSYYTYPINVDTVSPIVNSGPTLSPAADTMILGDYIVGQAVTSTYSCTDDRSGVVTCGASAYSPTLTTLSTGTITSNVNTSKTGAQVYTVEAADAAGNQSSKSANYNVIAYDPGIVITQQSSKIYVSVAPISGQKATGTVELYLAITAYQSAKLSGSGVAQFSTSGLHGTYSVSAVYAGNLSAPVTMTF